MFAFYCKIVSNLYFGTKIQISEISKVPNFKKKIFINDKIWKKIVKQLSFQFYKFEKKSFEFENFGAKIRIYRKVDDWFVKNCKVLGSIVVVDARFHAIHVIEVSYQIGSTAWCSIRPHREDFNQAVTSTTRRYWKLQN